MRVEASIDRLLAEQFDHDFLREAWGRAPVVARGEGSRFADLVPWRDLSEFLDGAVAEEPRFVLLKAGSPVLRSAYTRAPMPGVQAPGGDWIDPIRLQALLRSGATLQINGAQRMFPRLARACRRFARQFRATPSCNIYLSYAAAGAAPTHWDAGDGFFLQIAGSKHWRVFEPVRRNPLARDVAFSGEYRTPPVWEGVLSAGDVLYVPRGWFHAPQPHQGTGGLSLHATIGVEPITGIDLLAWLADELRALELFRRDLPRFSSPEEQRVHADALWAELENRWHDSVIEEFLARDSACAHPRGRSSLPWAVEQSLPEEEGFAIVAATARRMEPTHDNGTLVVEALGKRWRLDRRVGPLLRALLDGAPVMVDELPSFATDGLSVEDLRQFVTTLVQDGLLAVVGP